MEKNDENENTHSPKKTRKTKCLSFKDYLVDYLANSNLHGLKYIGEKERTLVEK